ncbi:MAG: hypothetical protein ACRD2J_02755 [Thermoanaerobaculia bacterium]
MKTAACFVLGSLVAAAAAADDCRHTAPVDVRSGASGVRTVEVRSGSGSLTVVGTARSDVRAHGTACASDEDVASTIGVRVSRSGDRLIVETDIPDTGDTWFWDSYARLDLTVELPAGVRVEIDDGSGSTSVRDVAALDLEDGSGSIDLRGIRGPVRITDGSGSIEIDDVQGPVRIEDGSGSIGVRSVRTDVVIEEDGSGSMDIAEVAGSVVIERDGSGSIDVRDVTGDLRVGRDGSGGISIDRIGGRVSIPRD